MSGLSDLGIAGGTCAARRSWRRRSTSRAQTDEIQVYDVEIAAQGIFNLMIHTNFTPVGRKCLDFPGAIIANDSVNGAAEWAYGVTPWFEQGLYMPVYSFYSTNQGATINGFKIRELFVLAACARHKFFYGFNFEFSVNALYWEDRWSYFGDWPIVGVHLDVGIGFTTRSWMTDYTGGLKGLQYNPAGRVAYNFNNKWAMALEQYDGFGPLRGLCRTISNFMKLGRPWTGTADF